MKIKCVWEHNGADSLLYAVELPGAYARGENVNVALSKMPAEIRGFLRWLGEAVPDHISIEIVQDSACDLQICDADSDVLFAAEEQPLTLKEYMQMKAVVLKSAADFLMLYHSVPDQDRSNRPLRSTFYGQVPRTAAEMYAHTRNVNAYYFGEINVEANNDGTIVECRRRAFDRLESTPNFLENVIFEGSYGECWTLRKVMRRFIWHDRIHAKAMYRMAVRIFGKNCIPNIFCFEE